MRLPKLAVWWSYISCFPTLCLRYTQLHETKGPGKQSKRYSAKFSAGWSQSGKIPWCDVNIYCTKIALTKGTGYPKWSNSNNKGKCTLFTVVSAITDCWHTKLRHVRYGKLQKCSKSNRRVDGSKASNGHTKDTTDWFTAHGTILWANIYVHVHSHLTP